MASARRRDPNMGTRIIIRPVIMRSPSANLPREVLFLNSMYTSSVAKTNGKTHAPDPNRSCENGSAELSGFAAVRDCVIRLMGFACVGLSLSKGNYSILCRQILGNLESRCQVFNLGSAPALSDQARPSPRLLLVVARYCWTYLATDHPIFYFPPSRLAAVFPPSHGYRTSPCRGRS